MNDRRRNSVRIDYDRLAEAIVKAQNQANQENDTKKSENKNIGSLFKIFIGLSLCVFIVVGVLLVIGVIAFFAKNRELYNFKSFDGWQYIILSVESILLSIMVTAYSVLSLKEVEKSNDINFLTSMFSSLMTFGALIVAAIALLK